MNRPRRAYAPAYVNPLGTVQPVGCETAWLPGAVTESREYNLAADPGDAEVFVAYRDVPPWQRLSESDTTAELDRLNAEECAE